MLTKKAKNVIASELRANVRFLALMNVSLRHTIRPNTPWPHFMLKGPFSCERAVILLVKGEQHSELLAKLIISTINETFVTPFDPGTCQTGH